MNNIYILGISCYYHDASAVILKNGEIIAAAQEERFSRVRHDSSFPFRSISYCLNEAGIKIQSLDKIVFYEDPDLKFKRLKKTYSDFFPQSIPLILSTYWRWIFSKKHWKRGLIKEFKLNFGVDIESDLIVNIEHHLSHAASAFLPSPYNKAAILVMDGVGEFATTSIWKGEEGKVSLVEKINFPDSIGLLYSAFTYYLGFKVNSGEYKVMGLAPYGQPRYVELIKNNLVNLREDGTYSLNMKYFSFAYSNYMTNNNFHELFGSQPREPESEITQREMDLARSLQEVTEELVMKLVRRAISLCQTNNVCLAGGVALNCVANGRILSEQITKNLWIQPAAGDAGGALGAALYYHYCLNKHPLIKNKNEDLMKGSYLGPAFKSELAKKELKKFNAVFEDLDSNSLMDFTARKLADGCVVGWFQGRMEFGPRALGSRSILGDARNPEMQKIMNLKIKFRESFRPFAPAVIDVDAQQYFKINADSPYMLIVAEICDHLKISINDESYFGIGKLNLVRSSIPAVTHVDYSARVQTVHEKTNSRFYKLLTAFKAHTGSSVLINTSFNVRGEPIVCTPSEAYVCFMRSGIDMLVIEDLVLLKANQLPFNDVEDWVKQYELD
jgi:carbamoyltransferase